MRRNREVENERKGLSHFVAGAALLCAGWYLLNIVDDPHGMMRTLPYVFLGSGCGIFWRQSEPYFYPLSDEKISGDR